MGFFGTCDSRAVHGRARLPPSHESHTTSPRPRFGRASPSRRRIHKSRRRGRCSSTAHTGQFSGGMHGRARLPPSHESHTTSPRTGSAGASPSRRRIYRWWSLGRCSSAAHTGHSRAECMGGRGSRRAMRYTRHRLGPVRQEPHPPGAVLTDRGRLEDGARRRAPAILGRTAWEGEAPAEPRSTHDIASDTVRQEPHPPGAVLTDRGRLEDGARRRAPAILGRNAWEGEAPAEPRITRDIASATVRQEPHPPALNWLRILKDAQGGQAVLHYQAGYHHAYHAH